MNTSCLKYIACTIRCNALKLTTLSMELCRCSHSQIHPFKESSHFYLSWFYEFPFKNRTSKCLVHCHLPVLLCDLVIGKMM